MLASGSADQCVKLWSLRDFTCLKTLQGHTGSVLGVTFFNFGTQVATAGSDGLIKFWNIRTSDCCASLDAHGSKKVGVAVKHEGDVRLIVVVLGVELGYRSVWPLRHLLRGR